MTNNKFNFTKAGLEALPTPPAGKRAYYYDTKMRSLGISITGNGVRSFIVYRWLNSKPERVTLRRFPDLSIEQARRKAEVINANIAQGENPNDQRRADRAEMTFGALFKEYIERHAKPHKRTWDEDQAQFTRHLTHWEHRKLSTIQKADIQKLHCEIGRDKTEEAVILLQQRKETATSEFVFPGTGRTGHITEPKSGWRRIRERAGIANLRPHDLRRTLGSWQARTGASLAIIGKSLNHKSPQATAIYARLDLDPVRASVEKATKAMLEAAGIAGITNE